MREFYLYKKHSNIRALLALAGVLLVIFLLGYQIYSDTWSMTNWIIIFFAFSGALNVFLTRTRKRPVWQVNSKGIFGYSGNTLVEPDINLFWGDIELVKKDIHPHTGQNCIYLKQKDSEYAMGLAQFVMLDLLPEPYVDNIFAHVKNYWENHKA